MKYFVAAGEDAVLDAGVRQQQRGDFIALSEGVTHYELTGPDRGPVIAMTGGLTIPLFYWDAMAKELHAKGMRTLAFCFYGRGYSDRVQVRYDEFLFARQLSELRKELKLTAPMHLVGTSMGALIAMQYAALHRPTLATLTFVGPAGLAHRKVPLHRLLASDRFAGLVARRFGRRLLQGHLGHNVRDPQRADELARMVLKAFRFEGSLYAFFDTLQHLQLSDRSHLYGRTGELDIPTLLLWGSDDRVTPADQFPTARDLLRPQTHHIIDECGHMAPYECPREVAEHIAAFVQQATPVKP